MLPVKLPQNINLNVKGNPLDHQENWKEVVIDGKKLSSSIKEAIVVPGSGAVKNIAESEGLDIIFKEAGFIWRDPGCSMCLGMNPDQLEPYERCASTSNRNFEGRQGNLGRTHLMSPAMAAYVAVNGTVGDLS